MNKDSDFNKDNNQKQTELQQKDGSFKAGAPGGGANDEKKNGLSLAITLGVILALVVGCVVYGLASDSLGDVMGTVLSVVLALFVLLAMITVHEFGHYLAGKAFGFGITEFALGFGPAICRKKKKNGEYFSVRALPIGGFCAFEGEDEVVDSPTAFNNRKPWQRIIVLVAGAFMNFVLALLVIMLLFGIYGQTLYTAFEMMPSVNYSQSLEAGDAIVSINGKTIYMQTDLIAALDGKKEGEVVEVVVCRGVDFITQKVTLRADVSSKNATDLSKVSEALGLAKLTVIDSVENGSLFKAGDAIFRECTSDYENDADNFDGKYLKENRIYGEKELYEYLKDKTVGSVAMLWVYRDGGYYRLNLIIPESWENVTAETTFEVLGVTGVSYQDRWSTRNVNLGFFQTIGGAFVYAFKMAGSIFVILGQLLTGALGLNTMGGTVTTIVMTTQVIKAGGLMNLLTIAGYIGVNLAVFNLLPLPALDGARVVFTLIEWVRGKPVNRNVEAVIHTVGLFLLFGFAILVDLLQLF